MPPQESNGPPALAAAAAAPPPPPPLSSPLPSSFAGPNANHHPLKALASPGGGAPPPATPPPLEPEVGGIVATAFGLASVLQVRSRDAIKCRLLSPDDPPPASPRPSSTVCVLQAGSYEVLSRVPLDGTTPAAALADHGLRLQFAAAREWKHHRAGRALELYQRLLGVAASLLKPPSHAQPSHLLLPPSQRGDWVVRSIKCHTAAAQIALHLGRPSLALDCTREALAVLDALERKRNPSSASSSAAAPPATPSKAHRDVDDDSTASSSGDSHSTASSSSDGGPLQAVGQVKLFGECRLRALLLTAQALLEMDRESESSKTLARAALRVLEQAQKVLVRYSSPQYRERQEFRSTMKALVGLQKELKRLKKQAKAALAHKPNKESAAPAPEESSSLFASPLSWFRPRRVWFAEDGKKKAPTAASLASPAKGPSSTLPEPSSSSSSKARAVTVAAASKAVAAVASSSPASTWTRRDTFVYGGVLAGGLVAFHYLLRQQRHR